MEPNHLYTIKWTQPYYTGTSFIAELRSVYEDLIEASLESGNFKEAKIEIERIMKL